MTLICMMTMKIFEKIKNLFRHKEIDPRKQPKKWIKRHLKKHSFTLSDRALFNKYYQNPDGVLLNFEDYAKFVIKGHRLEPCNIYNNDIAFVTTLENSSYSEIPDPIYLFSDGNIAQVIWRGNIDYTTTNGMYTRILNFKNQYEFPMSYKQFSNFLRNAIREEDESRCSRNIVLALKYEKKNDTYEKRLCIYFVEDVVGIVEYVYHL